MHIYNFGHLQILGFPTYQFFNQEYKQSCDISQFNQEKNIKYHVFAPIEVNGTNTHELFKYLKFNCNEVSYLYSILLMCVFFKIYITKYIK